MYYINLYGFDVDILDIEIEKEIIKYIIICVVRVRVREGKVFIKQLDEGDLCKR